MNPFISFLDDGPILDAMARVLNRRPASAGAPHSARWGAPLVICAAAGLLVAVPFIVTLPVLAATLVAFVVIAGISACAVTASRWAWLVPAAVRAAEFAGIIRISQLYPAPVDVPTFAFLFVIALHYYDIVYRQRTCAAAPARWARLAGGGWEVRLLLVVAISATTVLPAAMVVAASGLAVVTVVEAVTFWTGRRAASAR